MANQQNNSTPNVLEVLNEKITNIEIINTSQLKKQLLNNGIKTLGEREAKLRESTITIEHFNNDAKVVEDLEKNWVDRLEQAPLQYWSDKEFSYIQFPNNDVKLEFLELYLSKPTELITSKISILPANELTGQHITRRAVKCEITNVNSRISVDKINQVLNTTLHGGDKVIAVREGKQHQNTRNRSIMFNTNSVGIRKIIQEMDGYIQINLPTLRIKSKLNIKIQCKPWVCKDCFSLGKHDCKGKICGNCGSAGHAFKECKANKRHCNNCKKTGHKAKDPHCSAYQNEIIKELRRMDIPCDMMTNKTKRELLINHLSYA